MSGRVDLHTHSTASDGTLSPARLARLAKSEGLSAIALTDHDSCDGIAEFMSECETAGIEGIPGIEISTDYGKQIHIVGLYVGGEKFNAEIGRLKRARTERNLKMFGKLAEYAAERGVSLTSEEILENGAVNIEHAGRLHMANALVKKGLVKDRKEAFDRLLTRGKPCYVKKLSLSPEESVRLIKSCGGVAIWAHPALTSEDPAELLELAARLKAEGLDAMECLYSSYTEEQTRLCRGIAERAGLLESGGSDFHGANKPGIGLGEVSCGFVPYEVLEKLKKRRY